ncbi:unnamed protein product, partial [marine sediment metagenome]
GSETDAEQAGKNAISQCAGLKMTWPKMRTIIISNAIIRGVSWKDPSRVVIEAATSSEWGNLLSILSKASQQELDEITTFEEAPIKKEESDIVDESPEQDDPLVWFLAAESFLKQGNLVDAEKAFRGGLQIDPENGDAWLSVSSLLMGKHKYDEASLENAVKDVDAVIHFAAYFDFYPRDEKLMFKVNVEGTKNLMNACVGTQVQRFIYCSTTETMGPIRFPPGTEDTELIPSFSYGESKIQAENAIREISKDTDLPHIILRPTGVMGEGDLYVMLEVAEQLNEGKVFALPTDLSGQIMYTHVDDIVAGFVAALTPMSALNNTFILCPDESISWEEFVEVITTHLGVKPPRLRVPAIFAKFGMVLDQ